MEQPTLGSLLGGTERRDAIHVAIFPAVASTVMSPGTRVGIGFNGVASPNPPHVGIADPFLTNTICPGDRFYVCLFPNTVTGMQHRWEHPGIPDDDASQQYAIAKTAITSFAMELGFDYDQLMGYAREHLSGCDYIPVGQNEDYKDVLSVKWPMFWKYYEIVTNQTVPAEQAKEILFSCAC